MTDILVLSHGDRNTTGYRDSVFANHREYCHRHGYRLHHDFREPVDDRSSYWFKIRLIRQHLNLATWILWIDCDAVFANPSITLESIIGAEDRDLMLSLSPPVRGASWINAGVMFIRSSPWTQKFFDAVWDRGEVNRRDYDEGSWGCWCAGDQATIIQQIKTRFREDEQSKVRVAPHYVFNAREYDIASRAFIVHFPGPDKVKRITRYMARISPANPHQGQASRSGQQQRIRRIRVR